MKEGTLQKKEWGERMQGVSRVVFLEIFSLLQGGFPVFFFFSYLSCLHSVTSPLHLSIYRDLNPLAFFLMFLAYFVLIWWSV